MKWSCSLRLVSGFLTTGLMLTGLACQLPLMAEEDRRHTEYPEFLTPVASAQALGVRPYWLGERFKAGTLLFEIAAISRLIDRGSGVGLQLTYSAELGKGSVAMDLEVYPKQNGGAEAARDLARTAPDSTSRRVKVGRWRGELFSLPLATRPVNQLWLFVDVGETIVVARALSGGPGIPGQDVNPLIDSERLVWAMQNLRPYPE